MSQLRITEVFHSIQGETTFVGRRCSFIRLTGCDLRCAWCDSTYTFTGGAWRTVLDLLAEVRSHRTDLVCVTGGEPLLQAAVHDLIAGLLSDGLIVTLETGGHRDISAVDSRVHRIVDLKAPASGEAARNRWENIASLGARDEVKIVIADREDYEWARARILNLALPSRVNAVLVSPVFGRLSLAELASWILADNLDVRIQCQLHKVIWGDLPGV